MYQVTITEENTVPHSPTEILRFRTEHKPNLTELVQLLNKQPRAPRSDKGTTRKPVAPAAE